MSMGFIRFTDRARKVMQIANQVAIEEGIEWVDQGNVLVAIMREGDCVAARILKVFLGVTLENTEKHLLRINRGIEITGRLPLSETLKDDLALAIKISKDRGDLHVGTEHILLAMISTTGAVVHNFLFYDYGISKEIIENKLANIFRSKENKCPVCHGVLANGWWCIMCKATLKQLKVCNANIVILSQLKDLLKIFSS